MDILVAEDNFLVGEMIRLAVEDADFHVVGPAANIDDGMQLALGQELDGALLDINLGGRQSFPLARLLRSKSVPFIFVSGYDRSILPDDLQTAPMISKPVFIGEITRAAVAGFSEKVPPAKPMRGGSRADALRARIESGERRVATQTRRLQRLQFDGYDQDSLRLAADLLEQMKISVGLLKDTLRAVEETRPAPAASMIQRPISDGIIDPRDPRSLAHWADHFQTTPEQLIALVDLHGDSAHLIARAIDQQKMSGPCRKSGALE